MNKIDQIEKLLDDEEYFSNYINDLEKRDVVFPKDLNEKILSKVKNKRKIFYFDICKIAACLIFALAICQTDFIKNDKLDDYINTPKNNNVVAQEKVTEICNKITKPINIGGER